MQLQTLSLTPYQFALKNGTLREGVWICVQDGGWGDIAPLPKWSQETLPEAVYGIESKRREILAVDWTVDTWMKELEGLELPPAASFGLESALLDLIDPLPRHAVAESALLMGSKDAILSQAHDRKREGFKSAKLKVGNLRQEEAEEVIYLLKNSFRLRIDVNRAWKTEDSLKFFERFAWDAFDYVEEPFQNPRDLALFPLPLAVDESFPRDLSLQDLERLPTLKALVYKPTLQGGMVKAIPLHAWTQKRGVDLVLSSSFESEIGLACIARMAKRLALTNPIGIGTYHHMAASKTLQFPRVVTKSTLPLR